ncbi:hypothetical protein AAG570_011402 [Ranatra chinensis]|uniref:Uncharacterized protein n=1 Tax=Ranatra chinensis TaxID=642074 RepID=A0ABD0Z8U0_9HEMI
MASKRQNMFHKNKTQETTENGTGLLGRADVGQSGAVNSVLPIVPRRLSRVKLPAVRTQMAQPAQCRKLRNFPPGWLTQRTETNGEEFHVVQLSTPALAPAAPGCKYHCVY